MIFFLGTNFSFSQSSLHTRLLLLMGYVEWNFPSESVANSKSMILELDEMACRLTFCFCIPRHFVPFYKSFIIYVLVFPTQVTNGVSCCNSSSHSHQRLDLSLFQQPFHDTCTSIFQTGNDNPDEGAKPAAKPKSRLNNRASF